MTPNDLDFQLLLNISFIIVIRALECFGGYSKSFLGNPPKHMKTPVQMILTNVYVFYQPLLFLFQNDTLYLLWDALFLHQKNFFPVIFSRYLSCLFFFMKSN